MVRCNKELIKTIESDIIDSEITPKACDDNLLSNADLMDFRTDMDDGRSFYEKTDFVCEDLFMTANEETLWTAIVGEIKTPKGPNITSNIIQTILTFKAITGQPNQLNIITNKF